MLLILARSTSLYLALQKEHLPSLYHFTFYLTLHLPCLVFLLRLEGKSFHLILFVLSFSLLIHKVCPPCNIHKITTSLTQYNTAWASTGQHPRCSYQHLQQHSLSHTKNTKRTLMMLRLGLLRLVLQKAIPEVFQLLTVNRTPSGSETLYPWPSLSRQRSLLSRSLVQFSTH